LDIYFILLGLLVTVGKENGKTGASKCLIYLLFIIIILFF